MNQPNQAAQIAQDALTQLDAGKLTGVTMAYLTPEGHRNRDYVTGDEYKTATCHVCAQGALVVGYMTRREDEKLADYNDREGELRDIFGSENLSLIENCFEGFSTQRYPHLGYDYHISERSPELRLRKILRNLVRNDGEFMPQQDLT